MEKKKNNIAIDVQNVSKSFVIPHEQISTLRGAFVNAFKKKSYEKFNALDGVSFQVKKGEFFGIIGRNGSGKSTLLKMLAGIYAADTGKIHIDGRISPFLELGIGFNPELSGRDNIYLNATVLGLTKKQINEKFESIVAFSELERFIDQKIKNYSSGMQARLAFSVAIHANREILLMDEVLAVGDNNFQQKCLDEFVRYRELGKTVVLVSHDIDTIQKYCDRVLLLREGKIQKLGKPSEVYELYMRQNIADADEAAAEEMAESEDGKTAEQKRKRTNPEITKVEILSGSNEEVSIIQTNQPLRVRVEFDRHVYKATESINVGIGIYNDADAYVFSYNTQMDGFTVSSESNAVELNFPALPLLKGKYKLNVVLFGDEERAYFDFQTSVADFRIFPSVSTNRYRGIVAVDHEWK